MAFPASPSNNDVHKEGNRAFVYDSALGVWDQVRETDRTENKILSGTIGSGVTFPDGHVVQTFSAGPMTDTFTVNGAFPITNPGITCTGITSGNKCLINAFGQLSHGTSTDASNHANIHLEASGANMGIAEGNSGPKIMPEFGRYTNDWAFHGVGISILSTAVTTDPTYQFYIQRTGSDWTLYWTNWYITVQEIQQ